MFDPSLRLFVDDHHVRGLFGLRRVFGSPRLPEAPIIRDAPGRVAAWGCVLREPDGRWRAWYLSVVPRSAHEMATAGAWGRGDEYGFFPDRYPGSIPETLTATINYAQSDDGLTWQTPELGLFEWQGSRRNNIVMTGELAARQTDRALTNMDAFTVLRDEAAPPAERYKLVAHWETVHCWDNIVSKLGRPDADEKRFWAARAKYMTSSADGIHWNTPLTRVMECVGGGDYGGITRDERNARWWFNERAPLGPTHIGQYVRTAGLCASADLRRWPDVIEQVFPLGEHEDYGFRFEHHGMVPFNYGDMDLCFLELSIKGAVVATLLGSHRDGQRWRLVRGHEPFMQVGPPGSRHAAVMAATRNAPLRRGEELLIFYNGRRVRAEGAREGWMEAATLRLDGFAGLRVDELATRRHNLPAFVQTQPLPVTRPGLEINIERHEGTARVGLFDEVMRPIEGYELDACLPIEEDAVRAAVRWKDRADLGPLQGRAVIVQVQMRTGTLWAARL